MFALQLSNAPQVFTHPMDRLVGQLNSLAGRGIDFQRWSIEPRASRREDFAISFVLWLRSQTAARSSVMAGTALTSVSASVKDTSLMDSVSSHSYTKGSLAD